ncbi:DegV family protein with EDD domain [Metabacillus crassostreae]|uniref:DegV family protein n=1 Tax=Metabacillus crassostreae TaxID=929098 RepID=UPI00195C7ECD|nr:DegV family protein [Metabacillus crassostreae]MBM7604112.1 DegV family protein with EDD domain [Metabacillus crassostreae]
MNVHILADSACDLPIEYFEDHSISFLPLSVDLDGKQLTDQQEASPKKIYDAMRNGAIVKTSQVSPLLFKEVFTDLAKKGTPSIYVAFSSELSGTYQTAMMIRNEVLEEFPNFELAIIDSKCASLGYGLAVMYAVGLAEDNQSFTQIEAAVKNYCPKIEHIFTVDNLEYLARGGRISKASAFVGGLLNIKPLLHVEEGKLIPLEKIRGRKKVLKRIIEVMKERGVNLQNQTIAISHGDDIEVANEMKAIILEEFSPKEVYINFVGAVIGAHSGPGTLAIFFLNDEI